MDPANNLPVRKGRRRLTWRISQLMNRVEMPKEQGRNSSKGVRGFSNENKTTWKSTQSTYSRQSGKGESRDFTKATPAKDSFTNPPTNRRLEEAVVVDWP
ncbi:hypothetical protein AVEN_96162-1 [Araneus ventricosus]|uniref:Uncharacterized protein n=1 Tax=Araneus ventricosus TaxID=182803 RepID=A0A4Y2H978_ARAVE|nr:hypothetical protein AVEN_96162-1 [Araneus ventricosus]